MLKFCYSTYSIKLRKKLYSYFKIRTLKFLSLSLKNIKILFQSLNCTFFLQFSLFETNYVQVDIIHIQNWIEFKIQFIRYWCIHYIIILFESSVSHPMIFQRNLWTFFTFRGSWQLIMYIYMYQSVEISEIWSTLMFIFKGIGELIDKLGPYANMHRHGSVDSTLFFFFKIKFFTLFNSSLCIFNTFHIFLACSFYFSHFFSTFYINI